MKTKYLVVLLISCFNLLVLACDKPNMYAVSNYNIEDFNKRYQYAEANFNAERLPKPDARRICAAFAASEHEWQIFSDRLDKGPKGFPVLYAYSNYDLKTYNTRQNKAKVNLEKFVKETIPDSYMIADAAGDFYAASSYKNVEIFKTRIKEAMKHGLKTDFEILCYAMSVHPIDVFIRRLTEANTTNNNF